MNCARKKREERNEQLQAIIFGDDEKNMFFLPCRCHVSKNKCQDKNKKGEGKNVLLQPQKGSFVSKREDHNYWKNSDSLSIIQLGIFLSMLKPTII